MKTANIATSLMFSILLGATSGGSSGARVPPSLRRPRVARLVVGADGVADLDRDGRPDFITGRSRGEILWYRLEAPDRWARHRLGEQSPSDVGGAALDVDGDGWIDFVAGGAWYRNTGQPRTEPFERIVFDKDLAAVHDVVVADVDGDGRTGRAHHVRPEQPPLVPHSGRPAPALAAARHRPVRSMPASAWATWTATATWTWCARTCGSRTPTARARAGSSHENIPFGNPEPAVSAGHALRGAGHRPRRRQRPGDDRERDQGRPHRLAGERRRQGRLVEAARTAAGRPGRAGRLPFAGRGRLRQRRRPGRVHLRDGRHPRRPAAALVHLGEHATARASSSSST